MAWPSVSTFNVAASGLETQIPHRGKGRGEGGGTTRTVSASMNFFIHAAVKIGSQKREKTLTLGRVLVIANKKSTSYIAQQTRVSNVF